MSAGLAAYLLWLWWTERHPLLGVGIVLYAAGMAQGMRRMRRRVAAAG